MRQLGRPTTPTGSAMSNREQGGAAGELMDRPLPGKVIGGGGVERSG